jgi:hypothetical protein
LLPLGGFGEKIWKTSLSDGISGRVGVGGPPGAVEIICGEFLLRDLLGTEPYVDL